MKELLCSSLLISLCSLTALAQEAGNRVYGNQGTQQGGDVVRRTPRYPETMTEQVVSQDQIAAFQRALSTLGIRADDTYVDFITQNRVYDYLVKGSTAREKISGFQIKENLAIRFKVHAFLDQMVPLAAKGGIFDLIKVDYGTSDLSALRAQMTAEAQKIIKQKEEVYSRLGLKLSPESVSAEPEKKP